MIANPDFSPFEKIFDSVAETPCEGTLPTAPRVSVVAAAKAGLRRDEKSRIKMLIGGYTTPTPGTAHFPNSYMIVKERESRCEL